MPAHQVANAGLGARRYPLARGKSLVRRGQRLPGFCVLASGELKLVIAQPERDERVLGLVSEGATFAEAFALRRHACSYDIVALTDAAIVALPAAAIEALAAAVPRFGRNLIDLLAQRAIALQGELEANLLQRAPQRLAGYLCSLASRPGGKVALPVSKTLLAAILGMKKETLSRLLRELTERRLIDVSRRDITILDRRRLGEIT